MERLKNDTPINRRPARSRRDGSCLRAMGPQSSRDAGAMTPQDRREQRRQRRDRMVAQRLRMARRLQRRHGLDLDRLQRQVARRGGSLRIVIEFPAELRPERRPGRIRRPRFV